ncbi:11306_t:CDS:2 [Funneliformis caledonium]|uniref:11306_t:CDS:1 n=1 Tax=Funneliformis caledonium TaxID=1117310 RepID=A0A9N9E8R3_9GLOM|nr:11306_t:CDS:2 [Funneliformis caledonium]
MVSKLKSYIEQQGKFEDIKEEGKLIYGVEKPVNLVKRPSDANFTSNSEEYDQMLKTLKEEWFELNSYIRSVRVYARKI